MDRRIQFLMDVWILMSGGIDSTACAHFFVERGDKVRGVFVDYGQLAACAERRAAVKVANYLRIPLVTLVFKSNQHFETGEITGRNAFLIFAALMGVRPRVGVLSLGIHAGTGYYDCGQGFVESIGQVIGAYTYGELALHCPFLHQDKGFVVDYLRSTSFPMNLTYSCELGTISPCGQCLSCRDRSVFQAR